MGKALKYSAEIPSSKSDPHARARSWQLLMLCELRGPGSEFRDLVKCCLPGFGVCMGITAISAAKQGVFRAEDWSALSVKR
jgi:hypothetical protein